jgi:hypothetical protein
MKITRRQLKQLIKEELSRIDEAGGTGIFQKLGDALEADGWDVVPSSWTDTGGSFSASKGAAMDPEGAKRIDIKMSIDKM